MKALAFSVRITWSSIARFEQQCVWLKRLWCSMITDGASVLISTHISAGVPLRIRRYSKEKRWSVRQKPDTVRIEPDTEWLYFNISWVTSLSLVRTVKHKSIVSARLFCFYPSNEAWKGICTLIMYSIVINYVVIHNICILSEAFLHFLNTMLECCGWFLGHGYEGC